VPSAAIEACASLPVPTPAQVAPCGSPPTVGTDLGAQINYVQCLYQIALSCGPLTILCNSGGGPIATQIHVRDNNTLRLGPGDYPAAITTQYDGTARVGTTVMLVGDNSSVIGSGWGTILRETSNSQAAYGGLVVIRTFLDAQNGASLSNKNVVIRDLQIASGGSSVIGNGASAAITLGNAQHALVTNVYLNNTHAIGIAVGSSSASGNHADSATVSQCLFDGVGAVSLAAVNARHFTFANNRFRAGGNAVGGNVNTPYIDLEPNTATDVMQDFVIDGNILEMISAPPNPGTGAPTIAGIAIQGTNTPYGPGVLSNNIFLGGTGANRPANGGGIFLGAENVTAIANTVKWNANEGIRVSGHRNVVVNNYVQGVGDWAMRVDGSYNHIMGNTIEGSAPDSNGSYYPQIVECDPTVTPCASPTADYNYYSGNHLSTQFQPSGGAYLNARILLAGAHSVAYDNVIDGAHQTTRGSSVVIPKQISGDYTVGATDQIILANATSSLTVTLPTARPVPLIPGTDASLVPPNYGGDMGGCSRSRRLMAVVAA